MTTHALTRSMTYIHRPLVGVLYLAMAMAATLAFGLIAYASMHNDNFYRNTHLGTVYIGGMSYAEADTALTDAIEYYEENMFLADGVNIYRPTLAELGITIDVGGSLQRAWDVGHGGPVTSRVLDVTNSVVIGENVPLDIDVDTDAMYAYTFEISDELNVPMQNAGIEIIDGNARITPRNNGRRVDVMSFEEYILESVSHLQPVEIDIPFIITTPLILEEDLTLPHELVNVALSGNILMTHESMVYDITPATIGEWLTFVETEHELYPERRTLQIDLNDEAVISYFESIAPEIEVPGKARTVIRSVQREELEPGEVSSVIAMQKNIEALQEILLLEEGREMEILTESALPEDNVLEIPEPPTTEGKAISVDTSAQIAYAWLDGELQYFARVSTGKVGGGTPTGSFKVYNKSRDQKMSGADFYLPHIPYILWYNGDYSLHGTYWHNNFGTPMSHGCSNLSVQDARWFFEFADVGTPVIIFRSA